MTDIAKVLCNELLKQSVTNISGEYVVLAYFVDITKTLTEERIHEMATLPALLTNALHCQITVNLQFAYVGKLAFSV